MKIFVANAAHFSNPVELRHYCTTLDLANEAAARLVNQLRADIDAVVLPPVGPETWFAALQEAQRFRLTGSLIVADDMDASTLATEAECEVWIDEVELSGSLPETRPTQPAFDNAALGTTLAGLRMLQAQGCPENLVGVDTDGVRHGPMTDDAVDALCERQIIGGGPNDAIRIVVAIEGGLVSGVVADRPIHLMTIDYDTEGADEDDISQVPQDGGKVAEAVVNHWTDEAVAIDRAWIARIDAALAGSTEG